MVYSKEMWLSEYSVLDFEWLRLIYQMKFAIGVSFMDGRGWKVGRWKLSISRNDMGS